VSSTAQATSVTAGQNRRLIRLVRAAALVLVVATPLLVIGYLVDQHTDPGLTLAQRTIAETEQQVRQTPGDITLRLKLAAAYGAAARTADASTQYDQVLAVAPENVAALLGKAAILDAAGDLARAESLYQKVVAVRRGGEMAAADTELEHAYYGLGMIATAQHQNAEAVAALEAAVKIDGSDADAWHALGVAQLQAGAPGRAVEAERNAVTFVPLGWSEPYVTLAAAYAAQGDTAHAAWARALVDLIGKREMEAKAQLLALVGSPAAADADVGLAFVAEIDGDSVGALAWYRKALAVDPQNSTAVDGVDRLGPATSPGGASARPDASGPLPAGS
jgi:tetratricopeptide (TPR) repeat protein